MRQSITPVSPTIVGRDNEFAVFAELLGPVVAGNGQVVLITGEPGVGKTRLAEEFARRFVEAGGLYFRGSCLDSEQSSALAPWRDVLHGMIRALDHAIFTELVRPVAAAIRAIAPEFGSLLPGASRRGPDVPAPDSRELFHALLSVVQGVSRRQPLLVLIEDVHWADDASLECIRYVSHRIEHHAVMLVITSREEEVTAAHRSVVTALERLRKVPVLRLQPLTSQEVTGMLQAIFALEHPSGPVFTRHVFELTGGNPLFVEEVVASLVASGSIYQGPAGGWQRRNIDRIEVPATIQDAVQRREATLGADAREVLAAAAVIGHKVDFDLLAAVTGRSEEDLLPLLAALLDAHLLVEQEPDMFVFRHALTRQTIVGGLLARQRRNWHWRVATAMQAMNEAQPGRYFEDLADHLVEAGWWEPALEWSMRAGARSFDLGAPFAAIRHYGNAERAATALRIAPPLTLFLQRGRAFAIVGEFDLARTDFERVERLSQGAGEPDVGCEANLELGLLWSGRDYAMAQGYIERALAIARHHDNPVMLARCLNRMGNWRLNQDEPEQALALHREALAIFGRQADRRGVAESHDLMAMASTFAGDLPAAVRHSRQAIAGFEDLGNRAGIAGCFGQDTPNSIVDFQTLVGVGTLAGARAHYERAARLSFELDWPAGQSFCLSILGVIVVPAGDFGHAIDLLHESLAIAERIGHDQWIAQALWGLGTVAFDMGDRQAARDYLERALEIVRALHSILWIRGLAGTLARTIAVDGGLDEAEAILVPAFRAGAPLTTTSGRHLWLAQAELLRLRGRPEDALAVISRLYATARHLRDEGDIPALAMLKGNVLRDLGRSAEAVPLVERAYRTASGQGGILMSVHALTLLATLHLATGDSAAGQATAAEARLLIDRIAASIPGDGARQAYVRVATADLPEPVGHRASSPPDRPGGLTGRELEVALLVHDGLSNREIADRLYVSERTIESHVSNALHKLGFSSRAQIAAWAAGRAGRQP